MRRHRKHGFTLFELLVVISLMAIATSMGTVILVQVFDLWSGLKVGAVLDRTSQTVFSAIEQDLSQAVNSKLAGAALKGESASVTGEDELFGIQLAQDHFTVPVQLPMVGGGSAASLVGYRIERTLDGEFQLMRTLQSLNGGEVSSQMVAPGVVQMRVEYANAAGEWAPNWSDPEHPRAVRVTVSLYSPGKLQATQTARRAVFEVHAP